ncbi:MAG: type II secretion system F family protein [Elusimicrobiota bacterium]|jgi:type IV pilus assembly protein PilC
MPQFRYTARTTAGKVVEGVIDAQVQRAAMEKLRTQRMTVMSVAEVKPAGSLLSKLSLFEGGVKSKDLVIFSRQLATLVSAGVPIVQGLNILTEQIQSPVFKRIATTVRTDIESGIAIADAMRKHPKAFSELYVSMIRAGETGGVLDSILERLSSYLEAAEELRGKVKGAMVYPLVVSGVASAVTLFLLVAVIPTFKTVFASFGAGLPLPTQILLTVSDFIRSYFLFLLTLPIGVFVGISRWYKTEKGRLVIDSLLIRLPVIGDLLKKVAVSKLSRTLGTLIKSGVPILQALDTVAKTSGNRVVENAIMKCRESIREGEKIADPLKESGIFPAMVIQMISVGEETGNLETMLAKIADFYDQEVDTAVKAMTSLIEPVIICVMGVVIGAIVICMFLPIFQMSSLVDK